MKLPEEIVASVFVPTVRSLLAEALAERGLPQQAVADVLGVSQSAVSKYASGRFTPEPRLARDPRLRRTVERVADGLADGSLGEVQALAELMALVRTFETRGPICELHEEAVPALRGLGCDLCVNLDASDVLAEQAVLLEVQRAVRLLQATPGFPRLIPHVGSNVVMALPDARDLTDVAGIPGGLFPLRGEVRVPAPPDLGASRHVAEVALAVQAVDPERRAVLDVVSDDAVRGAAERAGLSILEVDAALEGDRQGLEAVLREGGTVPDLLYHRGAFGVEPIAYLTGPTATEVARRAVALLAALDDG